MEQISFTIPLTDAALTRTADLLHGLAIDLRKDGGKTVADLSGHSKEDITGEIEGNLEEETALASEIANDSAAPAPDDTTAAPAPGPETTAADKFGTNVVGMDIVRPDSFTTAPTGVELDDDKLPWDGRIHGSSRGKLAKTQQWKKKRGVSAELVATVEAELRAVMAASPANPITLETAAAPAPAADTTAAPAPGPETTVATTTTTTFPELMAKITPAVAAGTLTEAQITAAVNSQGLASLVLLAARPDLIAGVATELGL